MADDTQPTNTVTSDVSTVETEVQKVETEATTILKRVEAWILKHIPHFTDDAKNELHDAVVPTTDAPTAAPVVTPTDTTPAV